MTTQEKAKQIAEFLFTSAAGSSRERKAVRLVLIDENGKDLGGWSERAVARWVAEFLSTPDAADIDAALDAKG